MHKYSHVLGFYQPAKQLTSFNNCGISGGGGEESGGSLKDTTRYHPLKLQDM